MQKSLLVWRLQRLHMLQLPVAAVLVLVLTKAWVWV
jgi:hypothetical protein